MLRPVTLFVLSISLFCFLSSSCTKELAAEQPVSLDSSYFSIRQFLADQIHTYYGNPFTFYRIVAMNDRVDSALVGVDKVDWASVFGTFNATDISARKCLGKYRFSVTDDNITGDRGFIYTATDPKLFTQILQINADPSNYKISSIYMETAKEDFWEKKTQKLLYVPLHVIQIQEKEDGLLTGPRETRVEYRFPFDETNILQEE